MNTSKHVDLYRAIWATVDNESKNFLIFDDINAVLDKLYLNEEAQKFLPTRDELLNRFAHAKTKFDKGVTFQEFCGIMDNDFKVRKAHHVNR